MSKAIGIISDLHLCEEQPHLSELFLHFMQTIAPNYSQLYVLGDLFEVWVGDDHQSPFNLTIIDEFKKYSQTSGELFFMLGNRDFLLGDEFCQQTGGNLLSEPYITTWFEQKICLLHGDSLCTDDVEYQQFRNMVRAPQWQQKFLSQPLANRLAYAESVRQQSQAQQKQKTNQIMDVNSAAVEELVKQTQCDRLIHGHTHRENCHQLTVNNKPVERIVLSDWGQQGHYLDVTQSGIKSVYFNLP
ncbi:UDP-2,3-diacylglucosamine diphosphatase [Aliikangiella sp. IMCC44653]